MSTSSNSSELSLLVLYTDQLTRLLRFYEALGLDFTEERHGNGPIHFAVQLGTMVLELYPARGRQSSQPNRSLRLGFKVGSLDAVMGTLDSQGVEPNPLLG